MRVRLREIRQSLGLSLTDVAKASGVSRSEVQGIDNGNIEPKIFTLCKIAIALKLTLEDLVDYQSGQVGKL